MPFVLHLHRLLFRPPGGTGRHLKSDQNLIVSDENGGREIVFTRPHPERRNFSCTEFLARYEAAKREQIAHPLVLTGAFFVDFLAIHPVADGKRQARPIAHHP